MKRTVKQVENDFNSIKKFVKDNQTITSIKEIAIGVGITVHQVRTSLEKHPRVYSNIRQLIDENTEKVRKERLAEKEAIKARKQAEKEALKAEKEAKKAELEAKKNAKNEAKEKNSEPEQTKQIKFVIDASITGIKNLTDILNKLRSLNGKIVLTNITIEELDKMQRFNDTDGNDARKILSMAAGNLEDFMCVRIDNQGTADDSIIKYCSDNKENVVLLTSDKTMALTARTFGVKTHFLQQTYITKSNFTHNNNGSRANTLYAAKRIGEKLFISNFTTPYRSIAIISNGTEFKEGVYELKVGDDVYLATKKEEYLTFAHYCITSLNAENNCRIVFSRRIYDTSEIESLPAAYKSFMRQFHNRVSS